MTAETRGGDIERVLQERFGLERFRPGQREVIESVLRRRDVLCVMPTGGGKSLCYQLPALVCPGTTLVVSPLIALMKDQVDALTGRGIRATLINSTLDPAEQRNRMLAMEAGAFDLVYVAPERFQSRRFVEALARTKPALLAVDEAHCISEWGHDFRPDYARLGRARRDLGMPPCIALTATATDLVRRDIAEQLDLQEPAVFVTGFDRPNLVYRVVEARREADKLAALGEALDRVPGSAIVYTSSRKRCEEVARFLGASRPTVVYHAGMNREERTEAQDRFMSGDAQVVVATNAFGMGVDKPDIRGVIHYNIPGTLEAYYQEAGRAGRDGLPAQCLLLYAPGDRFLQEMFIENEYPAPPAVYQVYDFLRGLDDDPIELTQLEIRERSGTTLNESAVGTAIRLLEGAGVLERLRPRENMAIVRLRVEPDEPSLVERLPAQAHVQRVVMTGLAGLVGNRFGEAVYFQLDQLAAALGLDRAALTRALRHITAELPVDYVPPFRGNAVRLIDRRRKLRDLGIDFPALLQRKKQEYEKLDRMIGYAETRGCRRSYLLGYFGDRTAEGIQCGRCDQCGDPGAIELEPRQDRAIDTPAGREVLQKILSGVARAKGGFGKVAIAKMLVGSDAEQMGRTGLSNLSTFGILATSGFTRKEVTAVIDALERAGYVASREAGRFRPVVELSDRGWAWLRGQDEQPPSLELEVDLLAKLRRGGLAAISPTAVLPGNPDPAGNGPAEAPAEIRQDPLWESLRALRYEWAREAGVSAFLIFPNRVIDELVQWRPTSPQALARIKGIGPATMERYGAGILEAIRSAQGPASAYGAPRACPEPVPAAVTDEEWTGRLLDRGFTLEDCQAIRRLDRETLLGHALRLAQAGRPLPLSSLFTPGQLERCERLLREHGPEPPPEHLAEPRAAWDLFVRCRAAGPLPF
jgi:ATP-dependent DNA helicase RecQ